MPFARYESVALDEFGNVQTSPTVEVRNEADGLLAQLFSDRDGAVGITNPFTGDADGTIAFHVAGGAYKIIVTKGAFSKTIRYRPVGTMAELDGDILLYFATLLNTFPTVADVQGNAIQDTVSYIKTDGYWTVGDDGGATYVRAVSEPSHDGKIQSADGAWWELVASAPTPQMFGAISNVGETWDSGAAINSALAYIAAVGGTNQGKVRVPAGIYYAPTGVQMPVETALEGDQRNGTIIFCADNNVPCVTMDNFCELRHLTIMGKGRLQTINTGINHFGATAPAVDIPGTNCLLEHCWVQGGQFNIAQGTGAGDLNIIDVVTLQPYQSTFLGQNSSFHIRCKYDHQSSAGVTSIDSPPYAAWAATTAYSVGNVRVMTDNSSPSLGDYLVICTVAGTSGGSQPALANYGTDIVDGAGTLRWQLWSPDVGGGLGMTCNIHDEGGEVHYHQTDFTGDGYFCSIYVNQTNTSTSRIVGATDCVLAVPMIIAAGNTCSNVKIQGCETTGIVVDAGYTGTLQWADNYERLNTAVYDIGNNVQNWAITGTYFNGSDLTIGTGNDHFFVGHNIAIGTLTNGSGTSATKVISNNV